MKSNARMDMLRHCYPDQYEKRYGVMVLPTVETSVEAARARFCKQYKGHLISYRMGEDPSGKKVPVGQLMVFAALEGDEENGEHIFFVDKKRYFEYCTEFGYVIQDADIPCVRVDGG